MSAIESTYSEACQAFVLRDFDTASSLVDNLLEDIESEPEQGQGQEQIDIRNNEDNLSQELARRVYILYITLAASKDDSLHRDTRKAERELSGIYSRIQRYHASKAHQSAAAAATRDTASSSQAYLMEELRPKDGLVHPSIMVALSLAGLKLNATSFVRQTLEDYFQQLLKHAEKLDILNTSQGDVSALDASHADLSLSGIVVNGHSTTKQPEASFDNVGIEEPAINGSSSSGANATDTSRTKSLQRLSRIFSVNLLGKALGDWQAARSWIKEMKDDDAAHMAGLMSDTYVNTLLDTLDEVKAAHELEQKEAKEAEKKEKERQSELQKRNRATADSRRSSSRGGNNVIAQPNQNGKIENSTSAAAISTPAARLNGTGTTSRHQQNQGHVSDDDTSRGQETGFAAFRSHLTSFLATSHSNSNSTPNNSNGSSNTFLDRRRQDNYVLSPQNTSRSTLQILRIYVSRLANSRLLKIMLAFFIITGFWRRRLARNGSGKKVNVGETVKKVKDKIMETVKMGGSLGFL